MSIIDRVKALIATGTGDTFGVLPHRYIVSLPGERVLKGVDVLDAPTIKVLILELFDACEQGQAPGAWMNRGNLYLDVSESYEDYETAMSVARSRNQLAIYDQIENVELAVQY